jgi:hypothetical protein
MLLKVASKVSNLLGTCRMWAVEGGECGECQARVKLEPKVL